ncbi:ferredoxin [Candidatus Peregrinibacteria bacterium]|jgi:ferredoxin|nr:ferredoxin [Candidatus Peregrinibacteria bacterium]MBT7484689.1 ferredoxin [Candidatus Peregrinibacteria bacterium]MBT7703710.1 ferredoxin [Candidatus Peregrinibacteria bacterium]
MSSIKIIHRPAKCIGCRSCVTLAPHTWKLNEETGKAELIHGQPRKDCFVADLFECDVSSNQKAQEACPMNLIQITNI